MFEQSTWEELFIPLFYISGLSMKIQHFILNPVVRFFLLRYQRNAQATTNPHLGGIYCYKYTYTSISKWYNALSVKIMLLFVSRLTGSSHSDTNFPWPPPIRTPWEASPSLFLCPCSHPHSGEKMGWSATQWYEE